MTATPLCDRAIALAREPRRQARPRLVLAATILASSLDFVDSSVVNVGLPAIGRDLQAGAADLQWVVNAYLLPLSALLLLGGALGDRYGQRRLLTIGVALFAAGSAGCALAPGLEWLIAARAVQGLAAALVLPNSLAILGGTFEGAARSRAVGLWAASASAAAAVGPVLGGWLIDTVGWRMIFLINLPLAAAAIALAWRGVEADSGRAEGARLDLAGAVLITAALTSLTWGLTEGAGAWGWNAATLLAVAAGLALVAAFVWTEKRLGDEAMTPLALFGSRSLLALNLLTLLLYGALAGFMLLTPYLLITTSGYSATAAGAALLPFPVVLSVVSPAMGALAGRIGARGPLIAGTGLVAAGFLLALREGGGNYWTTVFPSVTAVALGMACAAAPLTAAVLGAVDARHTGAASGLNSALAQLGGVVAVALLGGVLASRGAVFVRAFHIAAAAGALGALAAGAAILLLFDDRSRAQGRRQASP
ncbi:MAG: transporter [Caulobacteraceae bacterium]|nr:transporter [Caulobacteraceae bacterium]